MERWKKATLWVLGITTLGGGCVVVANYLGYGPRIELPKAPVSAPKPEDPLDAQIKEVQATVIAKATEVQVTAVAKATEARKREQLANLRSTEVALNNLIEGVSPAPTLTALPTAIVTSTIPATQLEAPRSPTPRSTLPPPEATLQAVNEAVIKELANRAETRTAQAGKGTSIPAPAYSPTPKPGAVGGDWRNWRPWDWLSR